MQVIASNILTYKFSLVKVMMTKIVPIITSYPTLESKKKKKANPGWDLKWIKTTWLYVEKIHNKWDRKAKWSRKIIYCHRKFRDMATYSALCLSPHYFVWYLLLFELKRPVKIGYKHLCFHISMYAPFHFWNIPLSSFQISAQIPQIPWNLPWPPKSKGISSFHWNFHWISLTMGGS